MNRSAASAILPVVFFLLGTVLLSSDATSGVLGETSPPMVGILGTQLLKIHSSTLDREYELHINLPRNYQDTTRSFPVLFLLDSQWDFPLVNAVFGEQYYDGFVPDIVIVGIAAGGIQPNYDSLRAMDLTPTHVQQAPQSGGGPKFLQFIKTEVIPLVESKYRVKKDDRALMGSSLGGLFTLYAMFQETALFNRYILTSPAIGWDNGVLFSYEKDYAAKHPGLSVHLFMARAELEGGAPEYQRFVDQLKSRSYTGLDFHTSLVEGMGHSGGKAMGYARGLQTAYAHPTVELDPALLDSFVGEYQLSPEMRVNVVRESNQLVLLAPDSTKIPLLASSSKDFFVRGLYLFISFEKDAGGKVTGAQVEQFGGKAFMTKTR
ncbi:MAG: alpha/beta hydrolase-fold protein [Bacteroidota bacterium]